jgi:hypothetical protein
MTRQRLFRLTFLGCAIVLAAGVSVWVRKQSDSLDAHLRDPVARSAVSPDSIPREISILPAKSGTDELQVRILEALRLAQPAVVAVRHTRLPSAASGVRVSPDGLVLSQWHVSHAIRVGGHDRKSWQTGEPQCQWQSKSRPLWQPKTGHSLGGPQDITEKRLCWTSRGQP